jgi:exosome complex component RRP41
MKDLGASCAAGKMDGKIVLDLGDVEDKNGEADVPIAYMPKLEEITLLQMDGVLSEKETIKAIEMAVEGCKTVYEAQREALKKKYGMDTKSSEEELEDKPEETPEESEAKDEPNEKQEEAEK